MQFSNKIFVEKKVFKFNFSNKTFGQERSCMYTYVSENGSQGQMKHHLFFGMLRALLSTICRHLLTIHLYIPICIVYVKKCNVSFPFNSFIFRLTQLATRRTEWDCWLQHAWLHMWARLTTPSWSLFSMERDLLVWLPQYRKGYFTFCLQNKDLQTKKAHCNQWHFW
jgi:hypothetical protein